jgi:two-component system nitrogen regulation response regulator GlnG
VTEHNGGDDAPSTAISIVPPRPSGDGHLRSIAPGLTILWHYDLDRVGKSAALGASVTEVSRYTAPFDLVLDSALSRAPFLTVEYSRGVATLTPVGGKTAVLVDGQPLTAAERIDEQRLKHGVVLTLADCIVVCLHQVRTPVLRGPDLGLVGGSDVLEDVRRQIRQVADLDVPVLIQGQSGTGKELVARAIATASASPSPFVAVNMGSLVPAMAAADLFGHEKGAYTGANIERSGFFVEADGGTLFLDEIGETPREAQKMLLRVVETGDVRPVGGRRDRHVRVRLVTATDKDLDAASADGTFDGPLLNRIRGYSIHLPPLSERRADIGALFLHFLKQTLSQTGELQHLDRKTPSERAWLSAADFVRIACAAFPANLRGLRTLANDIAVGSRGKPHAVIGEKAARALAATAAPAAVPVASPRRPGQPTDADIRAALPQHSYNMAAAAKTLGISRTTLYERARALGVLRSADELTDDEVLAAYEKHGGNVERMAVELGVSPKPLKTRLTAVLRSRR